jgi:CPA1 family monovalent cation:H+ antiporter
MAAEVGWVLLVVLGICAAALLARRTGVPSPVLLVLGGLAVALVPGVPHLELEPEVILVLILPPLLYSSALESSLVDFRANTRPIVLLSVGLVVFTCLAVAAVVHLLVPGVPWAAALALGAILGPPDAVAAIAIGRRIGLPARLMTLIEGEGLLNDATALVLYQVAVAAVVAGSFSPAQTGLRLVLAPVGGLAVGLAVAWLVSRVRRRLDEPLVENVLSLATPFLAYLPAERLHVSGVVAVVICGLVLGHQTETLLSSASRLQTTPVWKFTVFLLEGLIFLLIGLQLPRILQVVDSYRPAQLLGWSAAVVLVVLLTRPLWIWPATYLPRRLSRRLRERDPDPPWQSTAALSWAGMRGVVSLAAAFAIPLTTADGDPFPERDLLLFLAFVAILTTLLLQGLTFARVLRALDLRPDRQGLLLAQASAQQAATRAGLSRLDELAGPSPLEQETADQLRSAAARRANAQWERLAELRPDETGNDTPSAVWRRLRLAMLEAERRELTRLRDEGDLPDEALREMRSRLDLEEATLTISRDS